MTERLTPESFNLQYGLRGPEWISLQRNVPCDQW